MTTPAIPVSHRTRPDAMKESIPDRSCSGSPVDRESITALGDTAPGNVTFRNVDRLESRLANPQCRACSLHFTFWTPEGESAWSGPNLTIYKMVPMRSHLVQVPLHPPSLKRKTAMSCDRSACEAWRSNAEFAQGSGEKWSLFHF